MWFYVQIWLPLLPIVYVVSCAVDQQTKHHVWWPPESRVFLRNERQAEPTRQVRYRDGGAPRKCPRSTHS